MTSALISLRPRLLQLHKGQAEEGIPPWRELSPRQLSGIIGVTVQALANWRYRGNGPRFTQRPRTRVCLYRLCDVFEWATGLPAWHHNKAWLLARGLVPDDADELYIEWVCSIFPGPR
ncbi:hypothetical protein DR046_20935 [Jannaschia formosa]|nr:hypothetical protein DR046_20935 [Jannaschia formosa]